MTELRWIILGIGVLFIAAVYLFSRRGEGGDSATDAVRLRSFGDRLAPPLTPDEAAGVASTGQPEADAHSESEPASSGHAEGAADDAPDRPSPTAAATPAPELEPAETEAVAEQVIMLHLVSRTGMDFEGPDVVAALRAQGLRYGEHGMFHRHADEGASGAPARPLFSVANMLRPGSFALEQMQGQQLRGVSLFMPLPGPGDPVAAFADMLGTGKRLAATLDAQLVDEKGAHITQQNSEHMREQIVAFQLARRVPAG